MGKKIFLTIICLVFFFVCACSQADSNGQVPVYEASGDVSADFGGMTFYFSADIDSKSDTFLSFYRDTAIGDAVIQRFSDVEKKYNCTIEESNVIESMDDIFTAAASGISVDAIIANAVAGCEDYISIGLCYPISALSDIIDTTDTYKWGTPNLLETFVYKDDLYGIIPTAWPETNILPLDFLFVFNSDMTAGLALDDPRDYFENGVWTRDKFEQVLKDYTFTSNGGNQINAVGINERHFFEMTLKSFGVSVCEKNEYDEWKTGYDSNEAVDAAAWVKKILFTSEFSDNIVREGVEEQVEDWVNGNIAIAFLHSSFIFSESSSLNSSCEIVYSGTPFALLPFPSDDGKTVYSQYERVLNGILFPSWSEEPECAATLINEIFEPIMGINSEEDMIEYYSENLLFDRRDAELLFKMQKVSRYLFHDEGMSDLNHSVWRALQSASPEEALQRSIKSLNSIIDKYIIPTKEGMEKLYGITD